MLRTSPSLSRPLLQQRSAVLWGSCWRCRAQRSRLRQLQRRKHARHERRGGSVPATTTSSAGGTAAVCAAAMCSEWIAQRHHLVHVGCRPAERAVTVDGKDSAHASPAAWHATARTLAPVLQRHALAWMRQGRRGVTLPAAARAVPPSRARQLSAVGGVPALPQGRAPVARSNGMIAWQLAHVSSVSGPARPQNAHGERAHWGSPVWSGLRTSDSMRRRYFSFTCGLKMHAHDGRAACRLLASALRGLGLHAAGISTRGTPLPHQRPHLCSGSISTSAYCNAVACRPDRWHSTTVDVRIGTTCLGNLRACT